MLKLEELNIDTQSQFSIEEILEEITKVSPQDAIIYLEKEIKSLDDHSGLDDFLDTIMFYMSWTILNLNHLFMKT
jgi:hypothetical protein